jgi:hypothetical protein
MAYLGRRSRYGYLTTDRADVRFLSLAKIRGRFPFGFSLLPSTSSQFRRRRERKLLVFALRSGRPPSVGTRREIPRAGHPVVPLRQRCYPCGSHPPPPHAKTDTTSPWPVVVWPWRREGTAFSPSIGLHEAPNSPYSILVLYGIACLQRPAVAVARSLA